MAVRLPAPPRIDGRPGREVFGTAEVQHERRAGTSPPHRMHAHGGPLHEVVEAEPGQDGQQADDTARHHPGRGSIGDRELHADKTAPEDGQEGAHERGDAHEAAVTPTAPADRDRQQDRAVVRHEQEVDPAAGLDLVHGLGRPSATGAPRWEAQLGSVDARAVHRAAPETNMGTEGTPQPIGTSIIDRSLRSLHDETGILGSVAGHAPQAVVERRLSCSLAPEGPPRLGRLGLDTHRGPDAIIWFVGLGITFR